MKTVKLYMAFVLTALTCGCSRHYEVSDPEKEVFNFIVTPVQQQMINDSRGIQYEVTDPVPVLSFAGDTFLIDRFEIRGDNTLNFHRKGFGLNMDRRISLYNRYENTVRKYEEYKLLAMVYDYTYIENCIGTGLFREAGLWPVFSFFTEVRLNNCTQGLYFFIEDPFEFFMEQQGASYVVRRGYDHVRKAWKVSPDASHSADYYNSRFKRIYSLLPLYSGKQIHDSLSKYLDLEQYFTKISIDLLIRNGDYTDEVIFFTKLTDGKEVLGTFPWDLDDIFSGQPHEIGNEWAPGTVFGPRIYNSMEDVVADVGSKLLYSVEDDLDYLIARDDYLYQEYLKSLRKVMEKLDNKTIDRVCDYTLDHIGAFYAIDSVIAQSQYDHDPASSSLFIQNLEEKREMLKERRAWIMQELNNHQVPE